MVKSETLQNFNSLLIALRKFKQLDRLTTQEQIFVEHFTLVRFKHENKKNPTEKECMFT